jgi:hypothetical protein
MEQDIPDDRPTVSPPEEPAAQALPSGLLGRHPWITFLAPFLVFWLFSTLEPTSSKPGGWLGFRIDYAYYPIVYTIKIAATIVSMLLVTRGYRAFRLRVTPLAVAVGVVGACFWIGLCDLNLELKLLKPIGLDKFLGLGERASFNPLEKLADNATWAHTFLLIRFVGLVLVVPVIEEFFLRGFLMRYVMAHDWWKIPFGDVDRTAVVVGTVVPMLMHPAELFAAAVWFSLVTWLMVRTRNIWDCVVAHAVTNLILGLYVVGYDRWELM